jgi:hypothetical protein
MCFESNAWKKGIHHIYMLTDIFRQSDPEFVNTLNTLRTGPPTNEILSKLNSRYKQEVDPEAIHIFTHNDAVLEVGSIYFPKSK